MRPEDSPYICWIDLECTGNHPDDQILEIGAIMTDRALNEVAHKNLTIRTDPEAVARMDAVVFAMHNENGLIEDSLNSRITLRQADEEMTTWIRTFTAKEHIPLAGSGVSHYDRPYIRKDLPRFDKYLTYWAYDTGVIRRSLKLFGVDVSKADTSGDKTHRAPDDIAAHVEEMRRYRAILGTMGVAEDFRALDGSGKPI
jgi:oligoribonuclease